MTRCLSITKNGTRCKNSAYAKGRCEIHSNLQFRFKDILTGNEIPNESGALLSLASKYGDSIAIFIEEMKSMPDTRGKQLLRERFQELRNKYHVNDSRKILELTRLANAGSIRGNEAIDMVASAIDIRRSTLISLIPDVANVREVSLEVIQALLLVSFGREALEFAKRSGFDIRV